MLVKSVLLTGFLAVLLCGLYPLSVTLLGGAIFPKAARGSLVEKDGKIVGSELIGQAFTKPEYFHGRPSAAGAGYDGANSSGSNLGPTSEKLAKGVEENVRKVREENPGVGAVPTDLVTASGSGLDPHLSAEGLEVQVERVAQARSLSAERVRALIRRQNAPLNVLLLNLALDRETGK